MAKWRTQIKSLFERFFPERQIYHRSSGTVNYIALSPLQQSVMAVGALAFMVWVGVASTSYMLGGSSGGGAGNSDREVAKLTRWNQELRAKEELSRSLLEERTDAFQRATVAFEERHDTLETLLRALEGSEDIEVTALRGNGADFLVDASIDKADPRQSREASTQTASVEVVGVRARIKQLQSEQERFLDKAEVLAVERSERARGILELASVSMNSLAIEGNASGGPLVDMLALGTADITDPEERAFAERVIQVAARLDEARNYENVVGSLPLAQPSSVPLRVTSPYGLRADPFERNTAWHGGVDMGAGAYGGRVPITATGPGTVVFAGTKSGYGRVVDVDHGFGFRSRYAHLRSISVKRGDEVVIGDKLGIMGSSGRSTGRHLHYEVIVQGKGYDPRHFLKAGQHVHEN